MSLEIFIQELANVLKKQKSIRNILESENSLLVNCSDESNFLISVMESKFALIHNAKDDQEIEEYLLTHSKEEFAENLIETVNNHAAFFILFMIFSKLREKKVIDEGMFYHILDNVIANELEYETFMARLLLK